MSERIHLSMSTAEVVAAMSEGNPGAIAACCELLLHGEAVDPDAFHGGWAALMHCDSLGIHGSRLYCLWNDVCERSIVKLVAMTRAYQLGGLAGVTAEALNHAVDNRGAGIDVAAVLAAVRRELPNFALSVAAPEPDQD
jgi:hypothetical protein